MSAPGWYPDPAGTPDHFRYWDGSHWSDATTKHPDGPPQGPRRKRTAIVVTAVIVAVVLVAAVVVAALWPRDNQTAGGTDESSPTVSAWNETSTPTTSPSSTVSPTTPNPTGGRPADCDANAPSELPGPVPQGGRFAVGSLSMPVPDGWSGPNPESRMPFGRDTWSYSKTLTEEQMPWASSMNLGVATFDASVPLDSMASTMVQCILTSDFYASVNVDLAEFTQRPITVSGRTGTQADALLTFQHPQLKTRGSRIRVVVVTTDDPAAPTQFFFSAAPRENEFHLSLVDTTTAGLRIG